MIVVFAPAIYQFSDCLKDKTERLNLIDKQAKNREEFCLGAKREILEIFSCYRKVEEKWLIPISLVEYLAKIIKPGTLSLQEVGEMHNNSCKDIPEAIIYLEKK